MFAQLHLFHYELYTFFQGTSALPLQDRAALSFLQQPTIIFQSCRYETKKKKKI